jgi:heme exporter protein D
MTDNIIATERKTNGYYIVCYLFFFLWLLYYVIGFSFCGYYIVCHLFFFLWLLYCLSFVFLSVAIILSVIWKEKQITDNIIATERKTNDR